MTPPLECSCGKRYWPKQRWMHEKCGGVFDLSDFPVVVANPPEKVANEIKVVANKSKHGVYKDKEARLAYMRNLMRKRRAA